MVAAQMSMHALHLTILYEFKTFTNKHTILLFITDFKFSWIKFQQYHGEIFCFIFLVYKCQFSCVFKMCSGVTRIRKKTSAKLLLTFLNFNSLHPKTVTFRWDWMLSITIKLEPTMKNIRHHKLPTTTCLYVKTNNHTQKNSEKTLRNSNNAKRPVVIMPELLECYASPCYMFIGFWFDN